MDCGSAMIVVVVVVIVPGFTSGAHKTLALRALLGGMT